MRRTSESIVKQNFLISFKQPRKHTNEKKNTRIDYRTREGRGGKSPGLGASAPTPPGVPAPGDRGRSEEVPETPGRGPAPGRPVPRGRRVGPQ